MTQTYAPASPIWCAGCGHFGVQAALAQALAQLAIPAHEIFLLAGIGCSGTIQNNLGTFGYHAMHGRVLPTAIGAALANPALTVIAAGGDGDGYAIGAGHLLHGFRGNPSLVYIVMNNGVYGLTKGQDSPTRGGAGSAAAIDAIDLGLGILRTTFLARGFSARPVQLVALLRQALEHARARRGLAFVEVLSPCVTYDDTYPDWEARVEDVDALPGYDRSDRETALVTSLRLKQRGRIPLGLIFHGAAPDLGACLRPGDATSLAEPASVIARRQRVRRILASYGLTDADTAG